LHIGYVSDTTYEPTTVTTTVLHGGSTNGLGTSGTSI